MIKAVVFDMDGLMFDTERLAKKAWSYAGKQLGYDIPEDLTAKTCGLNVENTKKVFLQYLGNDFDFYACRNIRVDYMIKYINDNGMPIRTGLIELLNFLELNNYKATIATSTERKKTEFYLKAANVSKYFDEIVCGDMIERGKPEPDIYLKAAEVLCTPPDECLALEDSPFGILSAYRAGLKPVMIPDLIEPDEQTSKMLYAKLPTLLNVIDLLNGELKKI